MAGRAVRRLAGNGTGQSLVDRMTSMKHSISGSLIAKTICKATTEEMNAPKRKHLNILVNCTYEPRLSMPEFANYIISRSHNSSWVVSFKALITIHHLMNCGSERFSQYLASNNCHLAAPRPFERSNSQAVTMLVFIRQYARYLDSRSSSYREVAFDFCKIKRKHASCESLCC
uniref:ENTH domain-containing protein n=1 Tax=Mesocestoides corti TaxID=53468 RepID=A0A5K3F8N6_MESCO